MAYHPHILCVTLRIWLALAATTVIAQEATSSGDHTQSNSGVVIHTASEGQVMRGSPPAEEQLVTRKNFQTTHDKLRWAMQHWRQLYPTEAVTRGDFPVCVLDRNPRDLMGWEFRQLDGSTTTIAKAVDRLDIDAFVVLCKGKIVSEHYFYGMRPETPHYLMSVNKSIVSTVIAALIEDNTLSLEEKIDFYVPELAKSAYAGATVRQILNMESAVEYTYDGDNPTIAGHDASIMPEAELLGGPVGGQQFLLTLSPRTGFSHGDAMMYKETDPAVLVWAAERATGKRFAEVVSNRLWSKLGAEHPLEVVVDAKGHWTHQLSVTARDLARWSQMLLRGGEFNDQRVVPQWFVLDIRTNGSVERLKNAPLTGRLFPDGVGYASFFYRDTMADDAIAAAGGFGQFCYISPKHNTAIVILSTTDGWDQRLAAGMTFEQLFEADILQEADRWHLCRRLCELLSSRSPN